MIIRRRTTFILGVGLGLTLSAIPANGQTVWIRGLTSGSTAELMLNADTVASGTADAGGLVQLAVPREKQVADTTMRFYLDGCGDVHRVMLVDGSRDAPPPRGQCQRSSSPAVFQVGAITTFVVAATGAESVLIRQGPAYDAWLHPVFDESGVLKNVREPLPTGLMISAGGAGVLFSSIVSNACGDTTSCSGSNFRLAPAVGASWWLTRFLGVEVAYLQPQDSVTTGTGTNLTFTTVFQSRIARVAGELGVQAGPTRVYALAGADYVVAVSSTTQTVVASAVGNGGTQTFAQKTKGWGFVAGGGFEGWLGERIALFAEGGRGALKGSPANNQQGSLDDAFLFGTVGVRVHIGRHSR